MVFLGIWNGQLFGYTVLEGRVTHQMYRNHVLNVCIPELKALNNGTLEGIYWQQDGAAVHRKREVNKTID